MFKIYDIAMTIEPDMPVYKDREEKKPQFTVTGDFDRGSSYETRLSMDLHTGTHLDMPLHFIPGGASSEFWSSGRFFTPCTVFDFSALKQDCIRAEDFPRGGLHYEELGHIDELKDRTGTPALENRAVLLKTVNSGREGFDFSFVYLAQSGAAYLAENKIAGVGIDALGIERAQPGHETHRLLLGSGIWILEGLRLGHVPAGEYILVLIPLKIAGVEALPVRAVLLEPGAVKLA